MITAEEARRQVLVNIEEGKAKQLNLVEAYIADSIQLKKYELLFYGSLHPETISVLARAGYRIVEVERGKDTMTKITW